MSHYETLTRRQFDITKLSKEEQLVLWTLLEHYSKAKDWVEYGNYWRAEVSKQLHQIAPKEQVTHPLYKIGQDLEMRLGIQSGDVAPPDYRDFIFDRIEEKYGSVYRFCKEEGLSEGTLSKVNAGKKNFSIETLYDIASRLGLCLQLVDSHEGWVSGDRASLKKVVDMLNNELVELQNLHDHLKRISSKDRMKALEQECGLFVSTTLATLLRELERVKKSERAEKVLELLSHSIENTEEQLTASRQRLAALAESPAPVCAGFVKP